MEIRNNGDIQGKGSAATPSEKKPFVERLQAAIAEWRALLPAERLIEETARDYASCTAGVRRTIPVALKAISTEEIVQIVKIATTHSIPLYTISTGKNWGYGTANPVEDNCAILDLSLMNRILAFDAELGWVKVEPGVTQQQLFDFFTARDLDFMVPVTGAGPRCSILGNLIERGYGITPHADHFGSLLGLEAVLPSGDIYRSALEEAAGPAVNQAFKWGVGPYLDGIFAQSNFGIVTSVTFAVQKKPECYEAFLFRVTSPEQLPAVVEAVREIIQVLGSTVGGINLMNARRVLSMSAPYPRDLIPEGETMSDEMVKQLATQYQIPAWTGAGAIYGNRHVVKAARRVIRQILARHVNGLVFMSPQNASRLSRLVGYARRFAIGETLKGLFTRLDRMSSNLVDLLKILGGEPSEVALSLCYLKSGTPAPKGMPLDPAKDGAGLIWYSPLVMMKGDHVVDYVADVERICKDNGIEPLITLTSVSERCFDSTVPILFDKKSNSDTLNAYRCYDQLLTTGQAKGSFPYRFGVNQMHYLTAKESTFWNLVAKFKKSVDPSDILSPGRYERR